MSLIDDKRENLDTLSLDAELIPTVESPYGTSPLTVPQHLAISAYWFATNFLWGALLLIMLPGELKQLAPYYRVPALSLVLMLSTIFAIVVPLIVGALSDRCASRFGRRRPYMVVGVAVNLVGLGLMYAAYSRGVASPVPQMAGKEPGPIGIGLMLLGQPAFLLFLVACIVVQLGNNIASAAYCGVIPDLVPEHQRGVASGYMALMSQLGTLFGGVGCGILLGSQPESVKFIAVGAVLTLVAAVTIFGIREAAMPRKAPKIVWGKYLKSLWIDPRKYPDFAWVWITRALVMLGFYSISPFLNYYLVDVIGVEKPERPAAILSGVILLAASVTGVYGGYVSDRVGRKRVVYVSNLIIAVMALAFMICRSFPEALLAGVVFGLGYGAYISVDWALGTDVLPNKKDAGKEMAVWHIAMTLPQPVAGLVAGFLIAAFGTTVEHASGVTEPIVHYSITGYSAVFVMCAVCFALGAYLLKNVRGVK
jgi:MFS family permease